MKRTLVAAVLAIVLTGVTPAFAAGDRPGFCTGEAALNGFVGEGIEAQATVDCNFKEASGVPGEPGYRPVSGHLTMSSDAPYHDFSITAEEVDVFDGGGFVSGSTSDGQRYGILVWDGGTPGTGNDEVWVIRYAETGPVVTSWFAYDGNLVAKAR